MSKYHFSPRERYAVMTVHGMKCYMCGAPVNLSSPIDHVIPESVAGEDELETVLERLGLPEDFNLNSYENWLPSCARCNGRKGDSVFRPTPMIQTVLGDAAAKAPQARQLEASITHRQTLTKAINTLGMALEEDALTDEDLEALRPLVDVYAKERPADDHDEVLRVTPTVTLPLLELLSVDEDTGLAVARGPYGVGGGPVSPSPAMRCGACGSQYFNGARCIACGSMGDF